MNPLGEDLAVLEVRLRYIYPNMREAWGKGSDSVRSWGATGAARGLALGEAGCVSALAWAYTTLLLACMS